MGMRLLGRNVIEDFKQKHATSAKALDRWVRLVEGVDSAHPADMKALFGVNVDFVGKQTVFDVGGNKVRVITKLEYGLRIVLVTHVLTHQEYDRKRWKE